MRRGTYQFKNTNYKTEFIILKAKICDYNTFKNWKAPFSKNTNPKEEGILIIVKER